MKELTPSKVLELKARHGQELRAVDSPRGVFVFKPPTRPAFDKWQDGQLLKNIDPSANARELAQTCLVSDEGEDEWASFIAMLDACPGILQAEVMTAICEMAGLTEKFAVKKL